MSCPISSTSIISNIHTPQEIKRVVPTLPAAKKEKYARIPSYMIQEKSRQQTKNTLMSKPLYISQITSNKSQYQHRRSLTGWLLSAGGAVGARAWGERRRSSVPGQDFFPHCAEVRLHAARVLWHLTSSKYNK